MRELVPRDWLDLQAELFAGSWNPELGRHRSPYAFRGSADATLAVTTSLARLGRSCADLEASLLRSFRRYARGHALLDDAVWSWLALGQHHGLPTRLLDWTFSPYVALHFVTEDAWLFDRDGIVWAVDYVAARRCLPERLTRPLERENAYVLTVDMLAAAAPTLEDFDALGDGFVAFFEPPSFDERIVNQHALLSAMPSADADLGEWLDDHEDLVKRIVIPRHLKREVRDKLDQANITERVLYPGLDGLGRWLARYYWPAVTAPPASPARSLRAPPARSRGTRRRTARRPSPGGGRASEDRRRAATSAAGRRGTR